VSQLLWFPNLEWDYPLAENSGRQRAHAAFKKREIIAPRLELELTGDN
jgi:hypothetical protein